MPSQFSRFQLRIYFSITPSSRDLERIQLIAKIYSHESTPVSHSQINHLTPQKKKKKLCRFTNRFCYPEYHQHDGNSEKRFHFRQFPPTIQAYFTVFSLWSKIKRKKEITKLIPQRAIVRAIRSISNYSAY